MMLGLDGTPNKRLAICFNTRLHVMRMVRRVDLQDPSKRAAPVKHRLGLVNGISVSRQSDARWRIARCHRDSGSARGLESFRVDILTEGLGLRQRHAYRHHASSPGARGVQSPIVCDANCIQRRQIPRCIYRCDLA
ncbi:hypothetical protein V8F33_007490 [Rhypophila sp. PSN 637]